MRKSIQSFPYLLLSLAALFWAGNFVVARAIHSSIAPLPLALGRWLLALILLLPFTSSAVWKQKKIIATHWKILTLLGTLGVGGFNTFVYFGIKYTTANNAILMNSVIPVLIIIIAALFFKQVISYIAIFGVFSSLVGVFVIISHGQFDALLGLQLNRGDLLIFLAVWCWALYTLALRWRPAELQSGVFLTITIAIGCCVIFIFYVLYSLQIRQWDSISINIPNLLTVAYLGIFPSLLAYACWNRAVAQVGASRAGLFIHLMPVFGALLSGLFLKETLQLYQLIGMIFIFSGILLTTRTS